jgi:hypothetical protein
MCIYTHEQPGKSSPPSPATARREIARKGSHMQLKHPRKPGRVTVPHPKRNIPVGTLRSIEKQAGLKIG